MKDYILAKEFGALFESGMLIIEIAAKYNTNRARVSRLLKSIGYGNLQNNKNQVKRQSEFMKQNNPVPIGTKRDDNVKYKMSQARKFQFNKRIRSFSFNSFNKYAKFARYIAYRLYGSKTPDGFEIDHKFSLKDGFNNKVPLYIISHPFNLQLLTIEENRSKGANSIISIQELYHGASVQRPESNLVESK